MHEGSGKFFRNPPPDTPRFTFEGIRKEHQRLESEGFNRFYIGPMDSNRECPMWCRQITENPDAPDGPLTWVGWFPLPDSVDLPPAKVYRHTHILAREVD